MRAWIVPKGCTSLDQLRLVDRPAPVAGPHDVVVRVHATSLNYRDQVVVAGQYFGGAVTRDTVPLSDGAGEVVAVGSDVSRFKSGDRVAATFFQPGAPAGQRSARRSTARWRSRSCLTEDGWVAIPDYLSLRRGGLPAVRGGHGVARAVSRRSSDSNAGDTVLVLGTGGVSIFALQLARAAGARVIATSSSDEKAARARRHWAPQMWSTIAARRTGSRRSGRSPSGRGVDCVVEIGGAGTLGRSMRSLARGGKIGLIGFLAGRDGDTNPTPLMMVGGSLHGIFVGDREMFEEMNRAIAVNRITPVVDRVFPFDSAPDGVQAPRVGRVCWQDCHHSEGIVAAGL